MENVGLFYLKTGGGHYSAAQALAKQMNDDRSIGAEPVLINPIENNQFLKNILEGGYGKLSNDFKYLWPALYNIHKSDQMILFIQSLMQMILADNIEKQIKVRKIQRIVILHFLLIKPVETALRRNGWEIPTVTVILDPFTAHPIWYTGNNFPIYCFSDQVVHDIINKGDNSKPINLYPVILDPKFSSGEVEEKTESTMEKYNFNPSRKRILIMGGGEGGGRKSQFLLQYLVTHDYGFEIIFVCGKSEKLYKSTRKIVEESGRDDIFLFGFVNMINELINVSDVVITKAGPASIMETLFMGKPLIVYDYMYGQEEGNIDFIERNKLGVFESEPERIVSAIEYVMKPSYLDEFKKHLSELNLENGTEPIAKAIMSET